MTGELFNNIENLEIYQKILSHFAENPVMAVLIAALESFIPPLPLIGIVTVNIALYGSWLGFILSWIGTVAGCTLVFMLVRTLFRKPLEHFAGQHERIRKGMEWIKGISPLTLFVVTVFPFTPSAFLNLIFGLSEYDGRVYLITICAAKFMMIGLLAIFGASFVEAFRNPVMFILSLVLAVVLYVLSKYVTKKHGL